MDAADKRRTAALSAGVALTLALLKGGAEAWTGSVGILASLVDSAMDVLASAVNYFAVRISDQPPDADHRYGHGKAESLAGLVQGLVILASGLFVGARGVRRLLAPEPLTHSAVGLGVMAVSVLASILLVARLRRVARETRSPALAADAMHYVTDIASGAAVFAGIGASAWLSLHWADPVVSLAVSAYIVWSAVVVLRESTDVLMDAELPDDERRIIGEVVQGFAPRVAAFHDLRTRRSGSRRFAELHLDIDRTLSFAEAHNCTEEVIAAIRQRLPGIVVTAHADPHPHDEDEDMEASQQ